MGNRKPMSWRDAFLAMAVDARARAKNSKAPPSGPRDPHTVGHAEGAAYAFSVMAEELEYLADLDSKTALKRLRTLFDFVAAEKRVIRRLRTPLDLRGRR